MEKTLVLSRRCAMLGAVAATAACTSRAVSAGRARADLYACEGCEAASERAADGLSWSTRIPPPDEPGEPLVLEGTAYLPDGTTPARGVVIYAHQTDARGIYRGGNANRSGSARHGELQAWIATGADGRFRFETIKPGPYPGRDIPAHIHLYIAEPGRRPYYVDDVVFDGEAFVDGKYRAAQELRGGSGIVRLTKTADGQWLARRNIVLERHPES